MPSMLRPVFMGLSAVCIASANAHANDFILTPIDRGIFLDSGFTPLAGNAYAVGNNSFLQQEYRNFIAFDFSSIENEVLSATLNIRFSGVETNDPFESLVLREVTSDLQELTDPSGSIDVFNDLGDGEIYGTMDYTPFDSGNVLIDLNASALESINRSGGIWIVGGSVSTLDDDQTTHEFFNTMASDETTLTSTRLFITTIPAPGSIGLLGSALLFGGRRRREEYAVSSPTAI